MDEMDKRQGNSGQTVHEDSTVQATFESYYNLLIVVPEVIDCFETVAILNYYGFPIHVEEDNYFSHVRKDMGFSKDDPYPMMTIDSATEAIPEADLCSKADILQHLYKHLLIGDYRTHSAWEK
jgi:hypothetical protein